MLPLHTTLKSASYVQVDQEVADFLLNADEHCDEVGDDSPYTADVIHLSGLVHHRLSFMYADQYVSNISSLPTNQLHLKPPTIFLLCLFNLLYFLHRIFNSLLPPSLMLSDPWVNALPNDLVDKVNTLKMEYFTYRYILYYIHI